MEQHMQNLKSNQNKKTPHYASISTDEAHARERIEQIKR
jgi:hypothetical protein